MLSRTHAGPGRTVKQEQEEISPNHVQRLNLISVLPLNRESIVDSNFLLKLQSLTGRRTASPSMHLVSKKEHLDISNMHLFTSDLNSSFFVPGILTSIKWFQKYGLAAPYFPMQGVWHWCPNRFSLFSSKLQAPIPFLPLRSFVARARHRRERRRRRRRGKLQRPRRRIECEFGDEKVQEHVVAT